MKSLVLAGGSGFLGRAMAAHLGKSGYQPVILTRAAKLDARSPREVEWDAETLGAWAREINGAEVVINLTGRSVDCRYNAKNRREIMESRIRSTRVIGQAIAQCQRPPRVWLNAS